MTYSPALAFEPRIYRYSLAPEHDHNDDDRTESSGEVGPAEHDDLPYRVELWDTAKSSVEQVLAVTANASIGYAAYYAATREHPDRYVTLRHKHSFVSRWNGPAN